MPENKTLDDYQLICNSIPPGKVLEGIELFNKKRYWDAHEALEEAWLAETSPAQQLYKGILQAGVMYLHIQRKNFIGMAKMFERSKKWLDPLPDKCQGINVNKLRLDMDLAISEAGNLGPNNLGKFNTKLFKTIEFTS